MCNICICNLGTDRVNTLLVKEGHCLFSMLWIICNVLIYNTYLKIKTQSQNNQKHKNKQHLVRFSIVSTQLKHLVRKGKTCVITHTRMHTPHTTSVYTLLSKHQKKLQALKKIKYNPCVVDNTSLSIQPASVHPTQLT